MSHSSDYDRAFSLQFFLLLFREKIAIGDDDNVTQQETDVIRISRTLKSHLRREEKKSLFNFLLLHRLSSVITQTSSYKRVRRSSLYTAKQRGRCCVEFLWQFFRLRIFFM